MSETNYVYGTAMTWDEWRDEWEDSGSGLPFGRWFNRQVWPFPHEVTAVDGVVA